jgi:hypothetical protein
MVRERRREYVAALLTMRRAYHVSGQTINFNSHCGYEQWSRSIRGTVKSLGLAPIQHYQMDLKERDPEKAVLTVIMDQWQRVIGWGKVRCSEVIAKAMREDIQGDEGSGFIRNKQYPEFFDALMQVAGDGSISSKRLGKYLDGLSWVVIGDRRFVEACSSQGVIKWRLEAFERVLSKSKE